MVVPASSNLSQLRISKEHQLAKLVTGESDHENEIRENEGDRLMLTDSVQPAGLVNLNNLPEVVP